jgi:hypothetical protein
MTIGSAGLSAVAGAGEISQRKKKGEAKDDRKLDFCMKNFYDNLDSWALRQTLADEVGRLGGKLKFPTGAESGSGGKVDHEDYPP